MTREFRSFSNNTCEKSCESTEVSLFKTLKDCNIEIYSNQV